jgi:hypothetical protein
MTGFGDPSFYGDRWADVYDRLAERYGDWDKRAFDSASTGHVSVYRGA